MSYLTYQPPKPILLVRFPHSHGRMERLTEFYEMISNKCKDYHVLAIIENTVEEVKFEIFNSNDVPEADIESIKEEIRESLKNS